MPTVVKQTATRYVVTFSVEESVIVVENELSRVINNYTVEKQRSESDRVIADVARLSPADREYIKGEIERLRNQA
jgi:hypothetical protein